MPPAYQTKHIRSLVYTHHGHTFHLNQSDDGRSNGTALWLSAQVLSFYLSNNIKPPRQTFRRPRAVELGSGVGLTALVLGSLGYDVLATDTPHVCHSVLRHNIAANLPHLPIIAGSVQVRELDWVVESDKWQWSDPMRITPSDDALSQCGAKGEDLLGPPFDIIMSSDTLYDASLIEPLFRTVQALAASSRETKPIVLLAFERRDPQLIESALARAPVTMRRVPSSRIRRAIVRAGIRGDMSDWEGVEIWRGRLDGDG